MSSAEIKFNCFIGGLVWATDNNALERAFTFGDIIQSKVRLLQTCKDRIGSESVLIDLYIYVTMILVF
ncbi:hypothetical protein RchiOBHm_Chr4g0428271 [Rosa chinensis]|uniref:Uncharacterized protein n=1 Tax=Rosa chinensis TaxID=74649 RepID=A0A2P6QZV8_ROSCH|nr:hypothetical protein RchiOBHm_Chr4g0428271 [Rosa chinensis]